MICRGAACCALLSLLRPLILISILRMLGTEEKEGEAANAIYVPLENVLLLGPRGKLLLLVPGLTGPLGRARLIKQQRYPAGASARAAEAQTVVLGSPEIKGKSALQGKSAP